MPWPSRFSREALAICAQVGCAQKASSPYFWVSFLINFRSLLALIPLAFVAGVLTFAGIRVTILVWIALVAGMFLSAILSQNTSSVPMQFISLISLLLAAGFAGYAIVTLVKRMSSKARQSTPPGEASA